MGLLPSASLSGVPVAGKRTKGFYEPIHGTAPDIAGQDKANPIGSILSVALLLRYSLGLSEEAVAVEKAVDEVLSAGHRTGDIADAGSNSVGTRDLGQRISDALESSL